MKKSKSVESSQQESLVVRSAEDIQNFAKSDRARMMSERIRARGSEPTVDDLAQIPELTEKQLASMRRVKEPITIRIDADILAWLKSQQGPYQTRVNSILRHYMEHSAK